MNNLQICQVCKVNPATYGDGLTWSRCSKCQREFEQQNKVEEPKQQESITNQSFDHQTIEGLTSIIMPLYMVSYTLFHYTGNAIGSIREHTNKSNYELIIIDNGSPIKAPALQSYYADKIITNEQNLGVTKAWNQGIRSAFGEYICLINNDTQVFNGWLEGMKEGLKEYDLVMAHPMYSLTEPFARAWESEQANLGTKKFDDIPGGKDFSCVMMRKSLLDEVGLFDEDFFNYCSDVEFLDRLLAAGKTFKIVPVYIHHVSDATGFSISETPDIMNKDKETYTKKKEVAKPEVNMADEKPVSAEAGVHDVSPQSETKEVQNDSGLIRSPITGDKIFLLRGDKTHWIKGPQVLTELGFSFGQEKTITREEFSKLIKGEDITMENVDKFK